MKAKNRKEIFLKALANGEEPKIKPLTREEILLTKQAERESKSTGGASGCDWNIMKNKPFGKAETVLLENHVLVFDEENGGYEALPNENADSLINASSITVVLDGVKYENLVPVVSIWNPEFDSTHYGNLYLDNPDGGADTGEPFCLRIYHKSKNIHFIGDNVSEHTISIFVNEIKPIDTEYLPEHLQFGEEVEEIVILENEKMVGGPALGAKEGYADDIGSLTVSAMVAGDTYIVTVDDTDYTGVAEQCEDTSSDGGVGIQLFSKGEYPTDFSDAPISFSSYSNMVYVEFEDDGSETLHSVKITHVKSVVKTIDPKYIPQSTGGGDTITLLKDNYGANLFGRNDGTGNVELMTDSELSDIYESGTNIILESGGGARYYPVFFGSAYVVVDGEETECWMVVVVNDSGEIQKLYNIEGVE